MTGWKRRSLKLFVCFHPASILAPAIAQKVAHSFRGRRTADNPDILGVPVAFRSKPVGTADDGPAPIDVTGAEHTGVILLLDDTLAAEGKDGWKTFVRDVVDRTEAISRGSVTVYPVALTLDGRDFGALGEEGINAIRYYNWDESDSADYSRTDRLIATLTRQLCDDLRINWRAQNEPGVEFRLVERAVPKVKIFLSHAKTDGEEFTKRLRMRIHEQTDLATFFDVNSLPPGRRFAPRFRDEINESAFLAVHTDDYSSREWCCREVLYAKELARPILVVNLLEKGEVRAFPYLGNVPVIRIGGVGNQHLDRAVARLLDEVMRDLLWHRTVNELIRDSGGRIRAYARRPETTDVAYLLAQNVSPELIVYPDPPLATAELELLQALLPETEYLTLTQLEAHGAP